MQQWFWWGLKSPHVELTRVQETHNVAYLTDLEFWNALLLALRGPNLHLHPVGLRNSPLLTEEIRQGRGSILCFSLYPWGLIFETELVWNFHPVSWGAKSATVSAEQIFETGMSAAGAELRKRSQRFRICRHFSIKLEGKTHASFDDRRKSIPPTAHQWLNDIMNWWDGIFSCQTSVMKGFVGRRFLLHWASKPS